jgi:hypothetical protein
MLPPAPRNYRQLVRHSHADGFRKAIGKEWNDLWRKGTMKEEKLVEVSAPSTILPVMWVFTYKFDEDGFLVKYKARLVVRGDLLVNVIPNSSLRSYRFNRLNPYIPVL